MDGFVNTSHAADSLGISRSTLRSMANKGLIKVIKTPGGHRMYNVDGYIREHSNFTGSTVRRSICYARVSSRGQKDDLQRQVLYLQNHFPNHELIQDIGSGLNFNRKGLRQVMDLAIKGEIQQLVVAYKDRLTRFGFSLFEYILTTYSNASILVLNDVSHSPEEELTNDILQVLTLFSARINGLTKYKDQIKHDSDIPKPPAEEDAQEDDGCI